MAAETPEGLARFVIWDGMHSNDEAAERDALLDRLEITQLSDVHGKLRSDFQPELSDELSFFLEYTGQGKLCTAFQRIRRVDQAFSGGILDQRVIALRPSVRAANCLEYAGIETVAELVRWTPEELIELPSMGRKTVSELISLLEVFGISSPSSSEPFATGKIANSGKHLTLSDNGFFLDTLLTLAQGGVSEKLAARLELYGIETLADLARWEAGRFWIDTNPAPEDLCYLASCLRRRGLRWGMTVPLWQQEHRVELTEAFGNDLIFSSRNAEISPFAHKPPASLQRIADSLNDELEMLFPKRADDRDRMIVKTYWGLAGGTPLTLEETAQRYSLTRERVRQIGKPFYRALVDFGQRLPFLEETVSVLNKLAPCLAENAERALESQGIVRQTICCESLLNLANEAGIAHSLVIEGSSRLLLNSNLVDKLKQSASYAAKMVSHSGVAQREEVLQAISFPDSSETGIVILSCISQMVWLDAERSYFWIPTGRSAVENRLISILHVAPDVALDEAYEGVLRDGRVPRERIPFQVFSRLCEQYPWCSVSHGRLQSVSPLPLRSQDSDEDIIAGFLRETSGVDWREELWEKAKSMGIGKPNFDRVLSFSTIIVRHGERLYGLIGTVVPVLGADVAIDTEEKSFSSVDVDAVDTACQIPPEGVAGLLAGCEPRSRMFPFQVAAAILGKSSDIQKPWSISELQLSASDRMAIREWGKHGTWDMRREMRKSERVGAQIVSGEEAISLTFFAFSSIITREDGIEGEMWPLIKSALGELLRQALFGRLVVPKAVIRDGTENLCRRLRIRHVFGREGQQSWLRTVFLQFGFSRRGIRGMDRWMTTREYVPVAVDDLLDHSRGLQSESFASMWQTLQQLRWRSITASEAKDRLHENPWLEEEDKDLAFNIVQSTRRRESEEELLDDEQAEDQFHLLVDRRLRLVPEPCFEYRLNPVRPAWCDQERYVLEAGEQRLPISRVADGWEFDHTSVFSIPLTAASIEVDLTRRRQSMLRRKLFLDLTPTNGFAFFDLVSGLEVDFAQVAGRARRGTIILHPPSFHVNPGAPEFVSVFDGTWRLSVFRIGIPSDLVLEQGDRVRWQAAESPQLPGGSREPQFSVHIEKGWWGDQVGVSIRSQRADAEPKTLIIADHRVSLEPRKYREWHGRLNLLPAQSRNGMGYLFCEQDGWIRRHRVEIPASDTAGIAVEGENGWMPLTSEMDVDARWLRGRRALVRPPAHEGLRRDLKDWAVLEGDRILARPRYYSEPLQGFEALGEKLFLAFGPFNNYEPWHAFARSVEDSGCIGATFADRSGKCGFEMTSNVGLGNDHAVWIWRSQDETPKRLDHDLWFHTDGQVTSTLDQTDLLGFAVSYRGVRIGSRLIPGTWELMRSWLKNHKNWGKAAQWLRWWRLPVRHPEIRELVELRARQSPVETILAWLTDINNDDGAAQLEVHEESWQLMTRTCLWGWRPNAGQSAELLEVLHLWTGNFQVDADCGNFDFLLATNPMLLAQIARKGAPHLYEGAQKKELAVLIRCLRDRVLEPQDGVRWQDTYTATSAEAAIDLNVDERFLQRSVIEDARRYVRGDTRDPRNLKLALDSMLLRRIVGSRLLEDTAEEWVNS